MTTNQTVPVTDEELDQMIWKLERDGMTPKMLSLMRELREVRRAVKPTDDERIMAIEGISPQFKPVADLYGITSPTGSETSFTFDANEAANFIEGGWSVQEYVELERYQEAMIGNSPATPDGWVMVPVEPTPEMRDAYHNAQEEYESVDGLWSPDHQWKAMIAAAPKEVG